MVRGGSAADVQSSSLAAGVVELEDTPALGAGGRKPMGVRVPPPAFFLVCPCEAVAISNRVGAS